MTTRTLTVTYDDQAIHDTLVVTSSDPGHGKLDQGVIFVASPSPTSDDPNKIAIGTYNVGDLTGGKVFEYALNVVTHIEARIRGDL
jgi:hypothetical protein